MNLKHIKLVNFIFDIFILTEMIMLIIQPILNEKIESLIMYALWVEAITIFILVLFSNAKKVDIDIIYILLLVGCVFVSLLKSNGYNELGLIGGLEFIITCTPFFWAKNFSIEKQDIQVIRISAIIKAIYFMILSFTSLAHAPYYASNGVAVYDGSLTLGYFNPNITALHIFNAMFVLLYIIKQNRFNKRYLNIAILSVVGYLCYLVVQTQCRIVIICVGIVIVLFLFGDCDIVIKIITNKVIIFLIIISSLIFLKLYYWLYNKYGYANIIFMGGQIFSRKKIFDSALKSIGVNLWFGNINEFEFANSHNGLLTILVNIGLVGLIIYLVYIFKMILRYREVLVNNDFANPVVYFAILVYYLHSCVEAEILAGSVLFSVSIAIVCVLNEYNDKLNTKGNDIKSMLYIKESNNRYSST